MTRGPEPGRRFDIAAAAVTIGRGAVNDIQVPGTWVSRQHARIKWTGTGYVVEDMGSTNGTVVNGVENAENTNTGFNAATGEYVDMLEAGVVDL